MPLRQYLRAEGSLCHVQLEDGDVIFEKHPAFDVLSATPWTGIFFPNARLSQAGSYTMSSTETSTDHYPSPLRFPLRFHRPPRVSTGRRTLRRIGVIAVAVYYASDRRGTPRSAGLTIEISMRVDRCREWCTCLCICMSGGREP